MVHKTFKCAVPHTNGKMIERDLIKRYNTLQALRNIIDGSLDLRYSNNPLGRGYLQDNIFRSLLSSWYATSATINNSKEIGIFIYYCLFLILLKFFSLKKIFLY